MDAPLRRLTLLGFVLACVAPWVAVPSPAAIQSLIGIGAAAAGWLLWPRLSLPRYWVGLLLALLMAVVLSAIDWQLVVITAGLLVCLVAGMNIGLRARVDDAALRELLWALAAVGALSAVAGCVQFLGWAQTEGAFLGVATSPSSEAFGNLRQRNQQASLLACCLCALMWVPMPESARLVRGFQLLVASLMSCAIALTASRTGFLAFVIVTVMALAQDQASRRKWIFCAVVVFTFALVSISMVGPAGRHASAVDRLLGPSEGCSSRRLLWANVLELIEQRPWTGWGWGGLDVAHFSANYRGERFCEILDNAHNLPLHLAVELGLPVALILLGLMARAACGMVVGRTQSVASRVGLGMLAVMCLHSLLEYPLWYAPFLWLSGLALGCALPTMEPVWRVSDGWTRASAAAILVAVAVAGLQYWMVTQYYRPIPDRAQWFRADPWNSVPDLWLFRDQQQFAALSTRKWDSLPAEQQLTTATRLLRYSPEPMVVKARIAALRKLGKNAIADQEQMHLCQVYPSSCTVGEAQN